MQVTISMGKLNDYCIERVKYLKQKFKDVEFNEVENYSNRDLESTNIILTGRLTKEELKGAENLKALLVPFTGINKFPIKEMHDKGIIVCNSHGKANIVAERAFSLAMTLLGRIVEMHNLMKDEGIWLTRKYWGEEFWYSMYNKKCGIYGMGSIGKNLINLLKPFNCEILGLERDKSKTLADFYYDNIEELAQNSDILFISVPLNEETSKSINKNILSKMKGKFIINVARGEVIDEDALYWALKENIIAGVGLDVWYNYPKPPYNKPTYPSKYELHKYKNVVMSPHASSHAIEYKNEYYKDIFDQLEYFLDNNKFKKTINIEKYL